MAALTDSIRGISKGKAMAMAVVSLALIAFFIVLITRMSAGNMVPLYTGLSLEDSAKIVAELDKTSVPYELVSGGTQIMVPSDRVLRLRMNMAQQGMPSGGSIVGYEIFDRSDTFGSSTFVMNVNMMRALEGELARTISSLAGIDSARVHLVMPKRELFSRSKDKPSASVTVKMRGGQSLENSEVMAIAHLVASGVPGLEASKVTIVDGHGRLLARGSGDDGVGTAASTVQEYRLAYENRMQQTLEDMLEKVVGPGKVRVQVAADINFDRTVINSEKYDPDGQVARSTHSTTGSENSQDKSGKDNVSVANNLPSGAAGSEGGGGSSSSNENVSEITNYEISKTTQNQIKEGGNINKISVAALVDGVYTSDAEGKQTYAPRGEDEIKQLKMLISTAIGFDEKRGDKIEVVNMRFTQDNVGTEEESFFQRFKLEMQSIIQTLIIAVVAILAIVMVIRPAVTQFIRYAQTPSERVSSDLAALEGPAGAAIGRLPGVTPGGGQQAAPSGVSAVLAAAAAKNQQQDQEIMIDVANIKGGMKSSSIKKITEIVDKYPEETMGVLRQWILRQS